MKNVLGIIIAFDNDNDLREITEHRTVGAVQWGGRYRIIDFMLSNMVNSGIFRVGVLMKDKYQSLIDHIGNAKDWDLSRKNSGVTLLPPYSYSKKASPLVTGTAARSTHWPARSTSCRKIRRNTLSSRTAISSPTSRWTTCSTGILNPART